MHDCRLVIIPEDADERYRIARKAALNHGVE